MPAPSPAPVCNFWPPVQQCIAASRNFAPLLEALFCLGLDSAVFPPLASALAGGWTASPCHLWQESGVTQFCLSQSNYHNLLHSHHLHKQSCAQLYKHIFASWRNNQEMWNSCVCCLWEKSGEFLVSNSLCSAPIGRNPQSPNSHTAVSAAESNHLGEKRIFLEESSHFPAKSAECSFQFEDLRGN